MTRLYLPLDLAVGAHIDLPDEAVRHLVQVLRMQAGDVLTVFNGQGGEYAARLVSASRKAAAIEVLGFDAVSREPALKVTIAQCVSKGDRMDYALQKCTELGAHAFIPVISERCVVRLDGERWEKKLEHWQGVVVSAAEQSGRTALPAVRLPRSLPQLLEDPALRPARVLVPGSQPWASAPPPGPALTVLVGPEGGLSDDEVAAAARAGWDPVALGATVLRTETAPVAALAALLLA